MLTNTYNMKINEYLPLRDIVFQTLRNAIITGELQPGERLMETQLAEKLGVSRTPIREAIRKLEVENFPVIVVVDKEENNLYETAILEYKCED